MGLCKKCKYYTTIFDLKKNNKELVDLIKAKSELQKRLEKKQGENEEKEGSELDNTLSSNESDTYNSLDEFSVITPTFLTAEGDEINDEDTNKNEENADVENDDKEDIITIPDDACFKWLVPLKFMNKPVFPFRVRKEKFLPPPITIHDMFHVCNNPEHVKIDHIKGDKWHRCCAYFNRFEECLLFEEQENAPSTEDQSQNDDITIDNTPEPPEEVLND